jgi:hypothetical protein
MRWLLAGAGELDGGLFPGRVVSGEGLEVSVEGTWNVGMGLAGQAAVPLQIHQEGTLITVVALSATVHARCLRKEGRSKATGSHSLHVPSPTYVIAPAPLSRPSATAFWARSDTAELAGFVVLAGMPFAEAEPCRDLGRILENNELKCPFGRFSVLGRQDDVLVQLVIG